MSVNGRPMLINTFREILESVDFYNSASCILGLAEVPDLKPPKLGWIQIPTSLEDLVEIPGSDTAKLTRFMNAVSEISRITYKCMNDDKQYMCFISYAFAIILIIGEETIVDAIKFLEFNWLIAFFLESKYSVKTVIIWLPFR